jgi:hypothetical protein
MAEWLEGLDVQNADVCLTVERLPKAILAAPFWAQVKDGETDKQSRFTARVDIPLSIPSDTTLGNCPLRIREKPERSELF